MGKYCEDCINIDICKMASAVNSLERYIEKMYELSNGIITVGNDFKCTKKITNQQGSAPKIVDCATISVKKKCGDCPEASSEYHIGDARYVQCKRTKYWHGEGEECSCSIKK